jgi:hypothetical protein
MSQISCHPMVQRAYSRNRPKHFGILHAEHPTFKPPDNIDGRIWRYMDFPRFVSILDRKALFFVKASKFRDPYEGTVPKYNDLNRALVYEEQRNSFQSEEQFNQFIETMPLTMKSLFKAQREIILINSWHYNEYESAAMWDLYSQANAGIAIQSTYRKLRDSFQNNTDDTIWIGKVNYLDFNKEWMDEWNTLEAFMIKRKSFAHENEIRAVTELPDDHLGEKVFSEVDKERERVNPSKPRIVNPKELTDKGKYVSTDLDILIENIYVSPSAEKWFKEVVESLVSKYGLSKNVIKSDLYTVD